MRKMLGVEHKVELELKENISFTRRKVTVEIPFTA